MGTKDHILWNIEVLELKYEIIDVIEFKVTELYMQTEQDFETQHFRMWFWVAIDAAGETFPVFFFLTLYLYYRFIY